MAFKNRVEAGKKLAQALLEYKLNRDVVILALPRGGVVVGAQIAKTLKTPLDLLFVRKIGHPNIPEYAIGAISEDGYKLFNSQEIPRIDETWLEKEIVKQLAFIKKQREKYLKGKKSISLQRKTVILVDDGIATGMTMEAAVLEVKSKNPQKIIIAVPVISEDSFEKFKNMVDKIVAPEIPEDFFGSVGNYYDHFPQISDKKVIELIRKYGFK